VAGRLYVGTSGFAYPGWIPRFYPAGTRPDDFLRSYATRCSAVELNGTYYRQPSAALVDRWLAATPDRFRFVVKAQRGGTMRSFADPVAGLPWLTDPYRRFGDRLGAVLFRIPDSSRRDLDRLGTFLRAWPRDLPLVVDMRDHTWHDAETAGMLSAAGAARCVTDAPDEPVTALVRTASPVYLRLRRHDYTTSELQRWHERIAPLLEDGDDAYVFFRHDEAGRGGELAVTFAALGSPERD
jgi:uncharacterized protein YecE (DUF72 family)